MKVSKPVKMLLVLSLLFGVYVQFFMGKTKVPSLTPAPRSTSQAVPQAGDGRPDAPVARPRSSDLAWGRDPFSRPDFFNREISPQSQKSAIKLEAILEGERGRVAIIDKQIVVKGDTLGDEKVQAIGKDRVVLVRAGTKRVLALGEPKKEEQPAKDKTDGPASPDRPQASALTSEQPVPGYVRDALSNIIGGNKGEGGERK